MINMAVGIDHAHHRLVAAMFAIKIKCDLRGFRRNQRINDGNPGIAFDKGNHRQVGTTHLIDLRGDFIQAALRHQLQLTPQAGVHRIGGFFALCKLIDGRIPDRLTVLTLDHAIVGQRCDEATRSIFKIVRIIERQLIKDRCIRGLCCFSRRFWISRKCGPTNDARHQNARERTCRIFQTIVRHCFKLRLFTLEFARLFGTYFGKRNVSCRRMPQPSGPASGLSAQYRTPPPTLIF